MDAQRRKVVVIIGGGLSGLAAAITLVRDGRYDVHLLEGSSELGGRVSSAELGDGTSVPMGATYFHGVEKKNSLLEIATQSGITKPSEGNVDEEREVLHILSDGATLPSATVGAYEEIVEGILEDLDKRYAHVASSMSLSEYTTVEFVSRTSDLKNIPPLPCSASVLLDCFLKWEGVNAGSKYLKDVDTATFGECGCLDARSTLYIPGDPFSKLIKHFTRQLPSNVIHLNSEVVSVQWNQSIASSGHPVTVQCANGLQYSTDHVILTVSLGVLKEKIKPSQTPFFSPPLPQMKQHAIEKLGFGIVNRIVLEMSEKLFDDDCEEVYLYWNKQDQDLPEEYEWLRNIDSFQVVPGTNHVTCFVVGDDALATENLSTEKIVGGMTLLIELFLHKTITCPVSAVWSQWGTNPLHCGSYSYPAVGSTSKDREILSAPLDGSTPLQLLFAGEATHPTLFSTANAAYDTGVKEALRIIDLTKLITNNKN